MATTKPLTKARPAPTQRNAAREHAQGSTPCHLRAFSAHRANPKRIALRSFTGQCPAGFKKRGASDGHQCSDQSNCTAIDCCQNFCGMSDDLQGDYCSTLNATDVVDKFQQITANDPRGCGDTNGDGKGDNCTAAQCCGVTCAGWKGQCPTGLKKETHMHFDPSKGSSCGTSNHPAYFARRQWLH